MKIGVIGAGVVGVATAYVLARTGHDVTVIERADTVASGASHANGAQLSYTYVDPFASPASLKALPGYLLGRDPAVQIRPSPSPAFWLWGLSFMAQCTRANFNRNRQKRQDLAALSKSTLASMTRQIGGDGLRPSGRGKIVLAHSETTLADMRRKAENDDNLTILSRPECIAREPALRTWRGDWVGGAFAREDVAIDPVRYCETLIADAKSRYGAEILYGRSVRRIVKSNGRVSGVETDTGLLDFDRVIVCTGNAANALLKSVGDRIRINPMRGYSLTLPASPQAPNVSITDMKNKIVYANIGDTIRIAGFMDANQKQSNIENRIAQLLETTQASWPDIADYGAEPNAWSGCRPMVPGGVPIIRQSRLPGLYLNLGHGSLGLTLAAGSAITLANCLERKTQQTVTEGEEHYAT